MKEDSRRDRRKAWCRRILSFARSRGDKRPKFLILEEAERRTDAINRAFDEAYRDKERAETVSLGNYPTAFIWRGEVLTRARNYIHPALLH